MKRKRKREAQLSKENVKLLDRPLGTRIPAYQLRAFMLPRVVTDVGPTSYGKTRFDWKRLREYCKRMGYKMPKMPK